MGLVDRILGRRHDLEDERVAPAAGPPDAGSPVKAADERAVAEYERLLRTAPPETIEKVHVEAFAKLTPQQLDILYDRFTANASTPEERPTDAMPATLAKTATEVEQKKPGTLRRVLGEDDSQGRLNTYVGYSILDAVIWYSIASTLWTGFGADGGYDGGDGDGDGDGDSGGTDAQGGGFDGFGGGFDGGGGFDF